MRFSELEIPINKDPNVQSVFEECWDCEGPQDADGCPLSFPELDCLKLTDIPSDSAKEASQ